MKNVLNNTNNASVIKIVDTCDFCFLEEPLELDSPISDYYFKVNDLSINVNVKLKWSLYAYFFMLSLSEQFSSIDDDYRNPLFLSKSINPCLVFNINNHILYVDDIVMNLEHFIEELNSEYTKPFYNSNSLMHFKLKVNILEFILLQNTAFPRLCFYNK